MEFPDATGIILAGGYSERFGSQNKALAEYQHRPLIYHVASELLQIIPFVIVNCRQDQQPAYKKALSSFEDSLTFALDATPGTGPLVGLRTACEHCTTTTALVLACDMPLVRHDCLAYLLKTLESDAVIPETSDGWLHPTHAAYRVNPLQHAITKATRDGKDRLQDLCSYLKYTTISESQIEQVSDIATLTSIDTPDDLTTLTQE